MELINPKKITKYKLSTQADHKHDVILSFKKKADLVDPLDKLISGDTVWYKNHNPHNPVRWLKAIFLRRVSRHILQVAIGSVQTSAHRTQIRPANDPEPFNRPNISLPTTNSQNMARSIDPPVTTGCEHPLDFTEELNGRGTKRKREDTRPDIEPRRSKRVRQAKSDPNYVYYD